MTSGPCTGAGLGLRPAHLLQVCAERPAVPWFEVHICNYLGGGLNRALLTEIGQQYPVSFHGVNLNLGGVERLDGDYLRLLRQAVDELQPALVSEHACFCAHDGQHFHDLMPIPYTEEAVRHVGGRIRQVQDALGRRILIENISRYYTYSRSSLSEAQFLSALVEETGCALLLDINNAWVNQCNLGEDVWQFVSGLPLDSVGEVHLGGFSIQEGWLIDTHDAEPSAEVWRHFTTFCELQADIPCLIEWDSGLPPLASLLGLQQKAEDIMRQTASHARQLADTA